MAKLRYVAATKNLQAAPPIDWGHYFTFLLYPPVPLRWVWNRWGFTPVLPSKKLHHDHQTLALGFLDSRPRKSKPFYSPKKVVLEIFFLCTGNYGLLRSKEYGGSGSSWWLSSGLRNCRSWAPLVEILAIKFPTRVFLQVVLALLRHLTGKTHRMAILVVLMVLFQKGCQLVRAVKAKTPELHPNMPPCHATKSMSWASGDDLGSKTAFRCSSLA